MSLSKDLQRIFSYGTIGFRRNTTVTIASLMVTTVTLFLLGLLIYTNAFISYIIYGIQEKVDVNIYFRPGTDENAIMALAKKMETVPGMKKAVFTSANSNLEDFKKRNSDDELVLQSLKELQNNPLGPSINIQVKDPSQYDTLVSTLTKKEILGDLVSNVEHVNYEENVKVINRLLFISRIIQKAGSIITIFFIIVSILLLYNGIKLGVYSKRDEIGVMKLIGADSHIIRGPFYVESILYAIVSALIAMGALYVLIGSLGQQFVDFIGGFDLFGYFIAHFFTTLLLLICTGITLGIIASWLATRKYLKV